MSTHTVTCLLQTLLPLSGEKIMLGQVNPHMEKITIAATFHNKQTSINSRKSRIIFSFYLRKHIS